MTDLRVTNLADRVRVEFTAPGDDLDSDDKAAKYVVKFSSTAGNLTGPLFDSDEWNTQVTTGFLIASNLAPVNGGSTKIFYINAATFNLKTKYMIAMKATDDADNTSPVSNKVQVFRPDIKLLGSTTESQVLNSQ